MRRYTVIYKRKEGSPISYISGVTPRLPVQNYTAVEKQDINLGGKVVPIPIVKGSHFRGRLRSFLADEVVKAKKEWIDSLPPREKQKVFKHVTLCFYVGNVQENEGEGNYETVKKLEEADAFFRYFGYMVANLPAYRSHASIGFALPAIEKVTVSDDLVQNYRVKAVSPEEIELVRVEIVGGYGIFVPKPLVDIETYRVAGKLDRVEKVGSLLLADAEEVKEIIRSYVSGSKKGGKEKNKEDMQNILFGEVLSPSYDLIQTVSFLDDEEKMHRGILYALKRLFEEEPFIGGRVSSGYGLIDEIVILDEKGERVEPTEEDFRAFVDAVNLEKAVEILIPVKKKK